MRKSLLPLFALVASCSVGSISLLAQDTSRPLWEQEAMLFYGEGSEEFNRLRTLGAYNPRLQDYARAVDILHGKVETEEAEPILVARGMFQYLADENPKDAVGMAARYYLAKIAQSNPVEQDLSVAKKLYLDLFEQSKNRFFGQMAFLKYAAIEIYDDPEENPLAAAERMKGLEKRGPELTLPSTQRNFHRLLGEGYVAFGIEPRKAFDHLCKAYDLGLPAAAIREDVLINIGRLGEDLGEYERALAAYDELAATARDHPDHQEFVSAAFRLRGQVARPK